MKNLEAVIPQLNVRHTVDELRALEVDDVVIETVKVFKKGTHPKMVYRGCSYEEDFTVESKIRFLVSDQGAAQAETILAHAGAH